MRSPKFDKHVALRMSSPDELESLDSCIAVQMAQQYRKWYTCAMSSYDDAISDDDYYYEGVPSQEKGAAIMACLGKMMPEHLREAAGSAREEGYLTRKRHEETLGDRVL